MRKFLISSLALAGFVSGNSSLASIQQTVEEPNKKKNWIENILEKRSIFIFAGHSSHSSHGSHSSHRSSSGGGTVVTPRAPSTPTISVLPLSPALKVLPAATVSEIVMQVQIKLYSLGLFYGEFDGIEGVKTRTSVKKFQKLVKLPINGNIDLKVLQKLGILD